MSILLGRHSLLLMNTVNAMHDTNAHRDRVGETVMRENVKKIVSFSITIFTNSIMTLCSSELFYS